MKGENIMREKIREICKQKGIKHKWIYDQLGVSKSHFSHYLRGDRDLASGHIGKIKELLEMELK